MVNSNDPDLKKSKHAQGTFLVKKSEEPRQDEGQGAQKKGLNLCWLLAQGLKLTPSGSFVISDEDMKNLYDDDAAEKLDQSPAKAK